MGHAITNGFSNYSPLSALEPHMMALPQVPLEPHMIASLHMVEKPEAFDEPHIMALPHRPDEPHIIAEPLAELEPHMIAEPLVELEPHIIALPPTNCELPQTAGPDHAWLVPRLRKSRPSGKHSRWLSHKPRSATLLCRWKGQCLPALLRGPRSLSRR